MSAFQYSRPRPKVKPRRAYWRTPPHIFYQGVLRRRGRDMKVEPEQRAALLGEYIAEHSATVRAAARRFPQARSGRSSPAAAASMQTASTRRPRAAARSGTGRAGPEQGGAAPAGRGGHPPEIQQKIKAAAHSFINKVCAAFAASGGCGTAPARPFPAG